MRVKGGVMRAGRNTRLLLCITVIIVIAVFLSTFIFTGCGKRAMARELLREKLEDTGSAESSSKIETSDEGNDSSSSNTSNNDSSKEETMEPEDSSDSSEEEFESEENESEDIESDDENESEDSAESEETVEVEESDEINAKIAANMPIVSSECGNNVGGGHVYVESVIYPGDADNNLKVNGYVSFDVSELAGSQIEEAKISGYADSISGAPFNTYGPLIIKAVYWGEREVQTSDFNMEGIEITNNSAKNFVKSPSVLKDDLQYVVNNGINRYQLCFYFEGSPDGDGKQDSITYSLEDIQLTVTYSK